VQAVAPGKLLRAPYLYDRRRPIVIAPVDDHLIFGPVGGLEDISGKMHALQRSSVDAILTYPGIVQRHTDMFSEVRSIINLTGSTTMSLPTKKHLIARVEGALRVNSSAVAVHINCCSKFAGEMMEQAAQVVDRASRYELPVVGIVYPRGERDGRDDNFDSLRTGDPEAYSRLVAHSVSLAASIGFDAIKTKYTGTTATFKSVVKAGCGVPVLIAGGPVSLDEEVLRMAADAMMAGAAGVSFGRNFFGRGNPQDLVAAVRMLCSESEEGSSE